MTANRKGSVAAKIVMGAMTLVIVTAICTSTVAIYRQNAAMEDAQLAAANLLATSVAISSATDIATGNIANLGPTVRRLRESNPQLLWILIKNSDNEILAVNPEQAPVSERPPIQSPIKIGSQKYGELHMIFDRGPIEAAREEVITTTIGLTVALLLAVFLIARAWARRFAQPIVNLAGAAEQVAHGDLSVSVSVNTNDEVGQLGDRFNDMVQNLSKSRIELERTLNELSTLYGVSKIINTTSDRGEILRLNIETLATGFHFSPVVILIEHEHAWRIGASRLEIAGRTNDVIDPAALGLLVAIDSQTPVVIDASRLPSDWGFSGKTFATSLRSGSNVVGLLIAGGAGANQADADKILSVVASQIAPPILISIMIEREMNKLTNPFEYIRGRLEEIQRKASGFGLGLSILAIRLEKSAWSEGAMGVERRFADLSEGIRNSIDEAELIVRYGANRLIAVVPGWTKADARTALMSLDLPHMDDIDTTIVSAPDDGSTAEELLAAVENSAGI